MPGVGGRQQRGGGRQGALPAERATVLERPEAALAVCGLVVARDVAAGRLRQPDVAVQDGAGDPDHRWVADVALVERLEDQWAHAARLSVGPRALQRLRPALLPSGLDALRLTFAELVIDGLKATLHCQQHVAELPMGDAQRQSAHLHLIARNHVIDHT